MKKKEVIKTRCLGVLMIVASLMILTTAEPQFDHLGNPDDSDITAIGITIPMGIVGLFKRF